MWLRVATGELAADDDHVPLSGAVDARGQVQFDVARFAGAGNADNIAAKSGNIHVSPLPLRVKRGFATSLKYLAFYFNLRARPKVNCNRK